LQPTPENRGRLCGVIADERRLRPSTLVRLANSCKGIQGRRFEQRSSHRRWNVDRDEAIGGEQVVLSALLDDSEVAVSFSIAVGDDAIDLVLLQ
jgi:hypothetical protein